MGEIEPLRWSQYSKIVVLTGAGISVASGLRPYRGPGGIWDECDVREVADRAALDREPDKVWRFFAQARNEVLAAHPNSAHRALAELERRVAPGASMTLLTQNIDGLHQAAGSQSVVELHGSLANTRCMASGCGFQERHPYTRDGTDPLSSLDCPRCPRCSSAMRFGVVLFGEPLSVDVEWAAKKALRNCDLFVAIGTSGTVSPASNYVRSAEYEGAHTVYVNLEPMTPHNPSFRQQVLGPADAVVPKLVG